MFAHCDVNAFYASCQTAFRPDLKGRPVVVLSNNDGCVIARSAEAKPFVKMGEPYFKQKAAFLRHGVVAFSSNYELYADMSSRVMATLEELTPRCEIYSIDEAFCDVSGVRHCRDLTDFGREIRATVLQRTHLTLGVGIAQTKTNEEMLQSWGDLTQVQIYGYGTMVGSDGKVLNRPSDTGSAEVIVERKISTAVVISEVN